jgi:CxxC-x17-CxxC domain-containing protein
LLRPSSADSVDVIEMPFTSDPTVTRERRMTKIRCSECGRDGEVPFVPTPGRPVFCRDCWRAKRDAQIAEAAARIKEATDAGRHVVWSREN